MKLRFWLVLFFLVVSACTHLKVIAPVTDSQASYDARAGELFRVNSWGLVGKLSLDDGQQGGSGSLRWDVKPGKSELSFHAAMGRSAWHLLISPEVAVLSEANGEQYTAADANALIQQRVGWSVPVDALHYWVRGLAAPGAVAASQLDADGTLISLSQAGWQVVFERYDLVAGVVLPVRLVARRDNYRVKLAVHRWWMGLADAPRT